MLTSQSIKMYLDDLNSVLGRDGMVLSHMMMWSSIVTCLGNHLIIHLWWFISDTDISHYILSNGPLATLTLIFQPFQTY